MANRFAFTSDDHDDVFPTTDITEPLREEPGVPATDARSNTIRVRKGFGEACAMNGQQVGMTQSDVPFPLR